MFTMLMRCFLAVAAVAVVSPAQHFPLPPAQHTLLNPEPADCSRMAKPLAFSSSFLPRCQLPASCTLRQGLRRDTASFFSLSKPRSSMARNVNRGGRAAYGTSAVAMASTPPSVQAAAPDPEEDSEQKGSEGADSWRVMLGDAAKGYIGKTGRQAYEDDELYTMDSWVSPLWMLTQEPDLNRLVVYLQEMRARINADPDKEHVIQFSNKDIEMARAAFSRMVRRGEMRLHRLCELTGSEIFTSSYSRQSVVVGQRPGADGRTWQRFQLVQALSGTELYAQTDLDLVWHKAALVANFVEYEALKVNWWGVYKCISRIKAEEEIWNKVVDEIFELDDIIKRDKQLRHLSRYVKDVFGMKMVVGNEDQARRVQKHLQDLVFADSALLSHGVPVSPATRRLHFVEVKDYLVAREKGAKSSGWRALKSVVKWWDTTIEIQIQVLRNYHRERERITKESHSEFKARRDELRDLIANAKPLFGFYRDLLQWLFQTTASERFGPPPTFKNVRVELID